jgi:hypothetical protein
MTNLVIDLSQSSNAGSTKDPHKSKIGNRTLPNQQDNRPLGKSNSSGVPIIRNVSFAEAEASAATSQQSRQGNKTNQAKPPPANPYLKENESGTVHIQRSANPARVDKVIMLKKEYNARTHSSVFSEV